MSDIPADPVAAIDWLLDPMQADRRFQWHAQTVLLMARRALAAHRELDDFAFAEVRHGDREVTVYKDVVIRSWGTCLDTEMSDAPRNMRTVQEAFDWLYALPPAPAAEPKAGGA